MEDADLETVSLSTARSSWRSSSVLAPAENEREALPRTKWNASSATAQTPAMGDARLLRRGFCVFTTHHESNPASEAKANLSRYGRLFYALRHRIAGNYAAQASNLDSERLIDLLLRTGRPTRSTRDRPPEGGELRSIGNRQAKQSRVGADLAAKVAC